MLSKRSVITNLKKNIEVFLKEGLLEFNQSYENIEFSKIAFSFDPIHMNFSFSLNTQFDQNKAVLIYSSHDSDFVKTNPKHWRYQNIGIIELLDNEHYDAYFAGSYGEFEELMLNELRKFMNSHVFKALSRSKDFAASLVIEEPFKVLDLA